jgi:hypothetical protein
MSTSIAIIVPYRDRRKQFDEFDKFFKDYLKGYNYKIFIIEQTNDNLKFNRGILLNIGFRAALSANYDNYIYHDVDLLPSPDLKKYYIDPSPNVIHIASAWSRYNNNGKNLDYLGGITRIPKDIFIQIGGFPVLYWGWGGEDDEVYARLKMHKAVIIRPKGRIEDLENLSLTEKLQILKKNDLKCMSKYEITNFYNIRRQDKDFLKIDNLERLINDPENSGYHILEKSEYPIEHNLNSETVVHIVADISGPVSMCARFPGELIAKLSIDNLPVYNDIIKDCYFANFTTRPLISGLDLRATEEQNMATSVNSKFPWFNQSIFHAGSEEQFLTYMDGKEKEKEKKKILTTFRYMSNELKKGIYIQIKDGIIKVFLPFSNTNYQNTWGSNLRVSNYKRGSIIEHRKTQTHAEKVAQQDIKKIAMNYMTPEIVAYSMENDAYELMKTSDDKKRPIVKVNPKIWEWYANNYMFRNELYNDPTNRVTFGHIDEGDKSVYLILKFFVEFVSSRNVPDCHLFINPRDMPVLKNDLSHPYPALYPGHKLSAENIRLATLYKKTDMLPIYSGATAIGYSDIPIPTDDDIKNHMWKKPDEERTPWTNRKSIAFFRGSATGQYIDGKNKRIQIAYLSKIYPNELDCGITSFNRRMKVIDDAGTCSYINTGTYIQGTKIKIGDLKKDFVKPKDQEKYKYIIDIQGHSAAYRLPAMLNTGAVTLKIDSPFSMFSEVNLRGCYYNEITDDNIDTIHYIKILCPDGIISVKCLLDTIMFLRTNDAIAQKIAENSMKYCHEYINRDYMFDYMLNKI